MKDGGSWYAYCGNDPVNRIDPSGYSAAYISSLIDKMINLQSSYKQGNTNAHDDANRLRNQIKNTIEYKEDWYGYKGKIDSIIDNDSYKTGNTKSELLKLKNSLTSAKKSFNRKETAANIAFDAAIGGVGGFLEKQGVRFAGKCLIGRTSKTGTELARQLGREGEDAAGIINPKQRIPSLSGTAKYRIPVELLQDQKILREIKNVRSQSYTNQLKDFNSWAKQSGYLFVLEVRPGAKLSGPLQEAINNGEIVLKYIGE